MFSTPTGSWIRSRPAQSDPTARRGRKHLEFFKIIMSKVTGLFVIPMVPFTSARLALLWYWFGSVIFSSLSILLRSLYV